MRPKTDVARLLLSLTYGRLGSIERGKATGRHACDASGLAKALGMRLQRLRQATEEAAALGLLEDLRWSGKGMFVCRLKEPEWIRAKELTEAPGRS